MIQARPTVYNGIQMRSRLEAGFAAWLDRYVGVKWEYEPACFGSSEGQYLPDFLIPRTRHPSSGEPVNLYVEIKPNIPGGETNPWFAASRTLDEPDHELNTLGRRMASIYASDPLAVLAVHWPNDSGYLLLGMNAQRHHSPVAWLTARWGYRLLGSSQVQRLTIQAARDPYPWHTEWWKGSDS